jgi:hypothetical protein
MKIMPHKSLAFRNCEHVVFTFNQGNIGDDVIATGGCWSIEQRTGVANGDIAAAVNGTYGTYRKFVANSQYLQIDPTLINDFVSLDEWTMMWCVSNEHKTDGGTHLHMIQYNAYGGETNSDGFIVTTSDGGANIYGFRADFQVETPYYSFTDLTFGQGDVPTWFAIWVESEVAYIGAVKSETKPTALGDFDEVLTIGDISGLSVCDFCRIGAPLNGVGINVRWYEFSLSKSCLFPT